MQFAGDLPCVCQHRSILFGDLTTNATNLQRDNHKISRETERGEKE